MDTFYWHDYETFGAEPARDRPAQFAGLRTDTELNEIGEPLMLYCRPQPDCLPQPEACLITGITPQQAWQQGVTEAEFAARIVAELGQPGTCGVGYNSLRFDDEVTRHTAWRNFHDPYAREWQNNCSRWDIIDMVRLTYALRPEGIEWPKRDDGQPCFRLEQLAQANGLEQQRAHDALSDVHATIALARLIRDRQPRLYHFVESNRDKAAAKAMLGLRQPQPVLHVSSRFPAEQGCLSMIIPLAPHPVNKNAVLVYDLRYDPEELLGLSAEDIHERIFTPREDLPDGVDRIPVKAVHINKCPVLVPVNTMTAEQAVRLDLDIAACENHARVLSDAQSSVAPRLQEVFSMGEFEEGGDPEQALYSGFIPNSDQHSRDRVPETDPAELAGLRFEDQRLNELLFRYRARHYPETLDAAEREDWQEWKRRRLEFAPDGGLNLASYQTILQELATSTDDDAQRRILESLRDWGQRIGASVGLH